MENLILYCLLLFVVISIIYALGFLIVLIINKSLRELIEEEKEELDID
jgi:hypothetical protein